MPTIRRIGPYRFFFFSNERSEPPHVYVQREQKLAKFWLRPVGLAHASRFGAVELRRLRRLVIEHEAALLEAWDAYFCR